MTESVQQQEQPEGKGKGDASLKIVDARRTRPPAYDAKRHPILMGLLLKAGMSETEACNILQINLSTLKTWKERHEEINATVKCKDVVDMEVVNALAKRAMGYETFDEITSYKIKDGKPVAVGVKRFKRFVEPNPTAQIFWLKNRRRKEWSDKIEHEHSGSIENRVRIYLPFNGRDGNLQQVIDVTAEEIPADRKALERDDEQGEQTE